PWLVRWLARTRLGIVGEGGSLCPNDLWAVHRQDGDFCVVNDGFGDTAEHQAGNGRAAVSAEHHQIDAVRARVLQQRLGGATDQELSRVDLQPFGSSLVHELVQLLSRLAL